jgi:hypothetical protein
MKIIYITKSNKKNKRFRVYTDDNKFYDFGQKNPVEGTYIDHKNKKKRLNYWLRHLGNKEEKKRLYNLTFSASVLSAYLLWGKYTNLLKNIDWLNSKL